MLSIVEVKKLKDAVERVLHVPGNFTGTVLEMTLVLDHQIQKEYIEECAKDIIKALKSKGEVFRNVRFNVVHWLADERMINEVTAMPRLMMSGYYEDYEQVHDEKQPQILLSYLKKFHARSKLVIIVSDTFEMESRAHFEECTKPFLGKKTILMKKGSCYDLHRDL